MCLENWPLPCFEFPGDFILLVKGNEKSVFYLQVSK